MFEELISNRLNKVVKSTRVLKEIEENKIPRENEPTVLEKTRKSEKYHTGNLIMAKWNTSESGHSR